MSPKTPRDPAEASLARLLPEAVRGPLPQNPAPFNARGQRDLDRLGAVADQIVSVYLNSLPSNYVSTTGGPNYVQEFRAIAEELARIQVAYEDAYEDTDFQFTRPEALYQFLASLVFPDGPGLEISGDLTLRDFLRRLVALLLAGSRYGTLVSGLEAFEDVELSLSQVSGEQFVFEVDASRTPRTATREEVGVALHYHSVRVNGNGAGVTGEAVYPAGTGPAHTHTISGWTVQEGAGDAQTEHAHDLLGAYPDLPFTLQRNVELVLGVLDPAQNLYRYRNLFRDRLPAWSDAVSAMSLATQHYDDFRSDWRGAAPYEGAVGAYLADRSLFTQAGTDFRSVRSGAELVVSNPAPGPGLPREYRHRVTAVLTFPYGDDPIPRPYTSAPSLLSGTATVSGGALTDPAQNWAGAVPGELVTLTAGPNAGTYLLGELLGPGGGVLGRAPGPATAVRPLPSFFRISPPARAAATGLAFRVVRDPGGKREVSSATDDVSEQAWGTGSVQVLYTRRGPLVNGAGSLAPATARDVAVAYDAAPLAVAGVEPYTGTVTLAAPLACFSPGDHTLTVTYNWYPTPTLPLAGLNRPGLNLNRPGTTRGRNSQSPGTGPAVAGTGIRSRFGMGVVLGARRLPRAAVPLLTSHRFVAFDRGYTAALNSPLSLRLNAVPGRFSVPYAQGGQEAGSASYGASSGELPGVPWIARGVTGSVTGGYYKLNPSADDAPAYWSAPLPTLSAVAVNVAARLRVSEVTQADGVWSGVGLGYSDGRRLYLAGALAVPNPAVPAAAPLQHVGLYARAGDPSLLASWHLGPVATGAVVPRDPLTGDAAAAVFASGELPTLLAAGDRFQVLSGNQSGVYRVVDLYRGDDGRTVVTVTPPFPADPGLYGNREIEAYFEVLWGTDEATWRLYVNPRSREATLYYGGASGGQLAQLTARLATADLFLPDVDPAPAGQVLWGLLSRKARAASLWERVAADSRPAPDQQSRGTALDLTAGTDPVAEEWYPIGPWGSTRSVLSGSRLHLNSMAASAGLGTCYAYRYLDPYLDGRRVCAVEALVRVVRTAAGAGAAALVLRDPHREARLGALRLYEPEPGRRALYTLPAYCLVGSTPSESQGWTVTGASDGVYAAGSFVRLTGGEDPWTAYCPTDLGSGGSYVQLRLAWAAAVPGDGGRTGLWVGWEVNGYDVFLEWRGTGTLVLVSEVYGGALASAAFDWGDGDPHDYDITYKVGGDVEVSVDGNLLMTVPLASFGPASEPEARVRLGYAPDGAPGSLRAALTALTCAATDEGVAGLTRTWGLFRGGDAADVDNWAIPRSDGSSAPNSDSTSAVVVAQDWESECWVRLFVDPRYGAVLLRPDLNPPAGYAGDWATESLDPTAAWARVEYGQLPRTAPASAVGEVVWGSPGPGVAAETRWRGVRYRVFTHTGTDYRAPARMTLNRANVVTSGEFRGDRTPEQVVVAAVTRHRVSLRPVHINASRVWSVIAGGRVLAPDRWRFNSDSQEIYLLDALGSDREPVEVVFAPGRPATNTYLEQQPWDAGNTILGEGTPPAEWSATGTIDWTVTSATGGPDPAFPPAVPADPDYFLRDPYLVRSPVDGPHLYDRIQPIPVSNGGVAGRVAGFDDSIDGQQVPAELSFSGAPYAERYTPPRPFTVPGSGRGGVLIASGGYAGRRTVLGPAIYAGPYTASTPNTAPTGLNPAALELAGPAVRYRETSFALTFPVSAETYATFTDGPAALSYRIEEAAPYSRLGPWAGGMALGDRSLLAGTSALQPEGTAPGGVAFLLAGGGALPAAPVPQTGIL